MFSLDLLMNHQAASRSNGEGPKHRPGKDDGMKKSETNTLRIEPRKVHAAAVGMAMVLIYLDYHYFVETFYWVFQPPFRIAIDTVTIVAIGLILNVVGLSEILATSRTYIVSTKGVTVIFLGIIRRLYPWQRFQSINVYPMDIGDPPWGGQPFLMVCSTVPIRTMEGGKIDLERALLRWPHILVFPLLPGEERMQFESLRRGEISPDLEDQEPDEEE